jgi:YegS/Rv2252/BmrU family lipid kinase
MRIAIVFNPGSGPRAARHALSDVVASLASHNHVLEVIDASTQPDFERYVREAAQAFDRMIAIGGDGTLNGVINGILQSRNHELPIAFVPTGRGKDTSRSLPCWKPSDMAHGAFELSGSTAVDVISITLNDGTDRYGINASDIGIAAHAAVVANRIPRWTGSLSYVLGAARSIVPPKPFALRFSVDGSEQQIDDALLLSVCNGRAFGGGIHIAPEASCSDGLLDIVVAHNASLFDLGLQLPRLKKGEPFDHPALMRWQGRQITVQPTANTWFEVDGEQLSMQPVRYDIAPAALNWTTP